MEPTPPPVDDSSASLRHKWLWRPGLIAFVSSACIMILELVAGRILAPYIGVSLYTWTGIIGMVLAGISLGNYLGGRMADHWASVRLLGGIFCASGVASLGILAVDLLDTFSDIESLTTENLPLVIALAAFAVVLFFLPCVILGTISPVVAKLAVRDLSKTGSTVGKIYAAGAVGSIVGTFATGLFLISWLGTHTIVWGVGVALLTLGLAFLLENRWPWLVVVALVLTGGSVWASGRGWLRGPCLRETNYYCIQVKEEEHGGELVKVLFLDRLLHSYTSLSDPTQLVYEYEQLYADATAYQAQRKGRLRALFIGGGGYTFPRYMEALYPDSELDVIEIDPGVTQVAYDMLGLSHDTRIETYNQDARMFLAREPDSAYDLVMGDAFNDFSVPYHLTTREFNERVRAWMAHDGLYLVNIIDGPTGRFVRAYANTLRQTFQHVYLVFSVESWQQSSRSTLVLIAGNEPLDRELLETTSPLLAQQLLSDDQANALMAEGRVVTLTDRYAPVDQMLASVFLDQVPR